ncbi:MAG: hypothetical protein KGZ40_06810 [Clostridiales bacterium]|nr:hypothetical protein [Clostridiales bacterium]
MSGLTRALRPRPTLSAALVAFAVLCAIAPAAYAQPITYTSLGVSLLTEAQAGGPLLLVSAVVPDDVPLPVEVALPVPTGSQIEWAGEIMGGAIENDIEADAVIEERDGATVAVFTLTTSRIAQVEVVYPDATRAIEGGEIEAGFSFVTPNPAQTARLAIALSPRGEVSLLPEGILASTGPDENTYYYKDVPLVAAGDTLALSLSYTVSMISPAQGMRTGEGGSAVPSYLIIFLAIVFAGSVLALLASKSRANAAAADDSTRGTDA